MKYLLILLMSILTFSCSSPVPIDNYSGCIIKEKRKNNFPEYFLIIQTKNVYEQYQLIKIEVLSSDYDRYNIGDTIK